MRLARFAILGLLAGSTRGIAAQECRPGPTALVLSGGGVKGLAHIGVLRALDSLGIRPDLVVGTSMGAIIGALYASGYDARQIDSLTRALPISEIVRPFRPPSPHPWDGRLPLLFLVKGKKGFELQTGIVDEAQPNARLNNGLLRGNLLARGRFDRLPIPFRAIATDLRDKSPVVLTTGDLARAVRASSAIPLIFPPVPLGDSILVDGGLSSNIPVREARAAGATRVIVSDVTERPESTLDVESPLSLADQLLGFLFAQAGDSLGPDDVMIRPAVQKYRSLDFSRETVTEILARGRRAADTTLADARCLPHAPRPPAAPVPTFLANWRVTTGSKTDSILVARLLGLEAGRRIEPARLGERLVELGDAEAFRGIWLNPIGGGDSVSFQIEPIRAPNSVGGAGVAYDEELGGRAWAGLFNRRAFGTTLEASGLVSLGRFESEAAVTALWHVDAGSSHITPLIRGRLRTEKVRRFDPDGAELAAVSTGDARATVGFEARLGPPWRIRAAADGFAWGAEPLRGRTALGGSLRLTRAWRSGPQLDGEAIATGAFRSAKLVTTWPAATRDWSVLPTVRVAVGADLPLQWTFPLGGDDGFPGLHIGEERGSREVSGSLRIGRMIKRPLQLRLLVAGGRAWSEGPGQPDWLGGARLGLGADTPIGPMDVAYGVATNGRGAIYVRLGTWF